MVVVVCIVLVVDYAAFADTLNLSFALVYFGVVVAFKKY